MRIGLFSDTYTPDINGVVSSIVTLQHQLEKNGHEVYVITNHKALITTQWEGNVLRLPGLELKWLYGYKLSTPYHFSAKEEIRKLNLDVIHVHTEFGVGIFARLVAKSLDIPVVSTYHTMYEDYTHYVNKFDINEIDKVTKKITSVFSRSISDTCQGVIAPSDKTKETLIKYGVKTPIYVIPTGLDLSEFDPQRADYEKAAQLRLAYGIQPEDKVIAYVGRIAKEKSIDLAIEGFRYVKDSNLKLLIVGGGPQLKELKELAASYNLLDKVKFTDKIPRADISTYYFCADAFVSASLTETQGMTFIEALACGLPVFARPDDVLTDLVIENVSGYLFQEPQEFAAKVEAFYELDVLHRQKMKQHAREKALMYDADIFYHKVLSVYYQAIDDYEDCYTVTKIKQMDDCVRIYAENEKEDEPTKILISIEDYFEFKIRIGTRIDRSQMEDFQHKEQVINAYRMCIRKLRSKDRTKKELADLLRSQENLNSEDIDQVIGALEVKGYINDYLYMTAKIDKMRSSLQGRSKIIYTLMKKGIPREMIEAALESSDELEEGNAESMAKRLQNSIKDRSLNMKKQMIVSKLISSGYSSSIANEAVGKLNFDDEMDNEQEALLKTIQKAIRTYERKYKGTPLKNKVIRYCINKGFASGDVLAAVNEMEWGENE